jgi:hypothetical protein
VNEPCQAFFADAAFADDQDRRINFGNSRRDADDSLHRRTEHTETKFLLGTMPV